MFYSILLSFLVNQQTLAQVVIEEEVVLDTAVGTESINLTMPFYGIVGIYFQPHATNTCGAFMNGTICIKASVGSYQGSNPNNSTCCGSTSGCGGFPGQTPYQNTFNNIPMGTPVSLTIDWKVNGVWTPLDFWYVQSGNTYNMYSVDTSSGCPSGVAYLGYIKFVASNPPGCTLAPNCESGYVETMPPLSFENREPSFITGVEDCNQNPNLLGYFVPGSRQSEATDLLGYNTSNIDLCFDPQTQQFKFDLSNLYVTLYYVKYICDDNIHAPNINATIVDNIDQIDLITLDRCMDLFNSISAHYVYPPWNYGGIHDGFVFREIIETHETQHLFDWQNIIEKYQSAYYAIPEIISNKCSDFTTYLLAKEKTLNKIKELFFANFWNKTRDDYLKNNHLLKININGVLQEDPLKREHEISHHNKKVIQDLIDKYKFKILVHCGSIIGKEN